MNKYQKLIKLITDNNLTIHKEPCFDSPSGCRGENIYIRDGRTNIFDLSMNGYCFTDLSVDDAITEINRYLEYKNMVSFDAFKKWVEEYKER